MIAVGVARNELRRHAKALQGFPAFSHVRVNRERPPEVRDGVLAPA